MERSLREQLIVGALLAYADELPERVSGLTVGQTIAVLRRRLKMSQAALAQRCKTSQPQIAKIEGGRANPSWKTLTRIFEALECDCQLIPTFRHPPDEVLRERAERIARRRVRQLEGTMALEAQPLREDFTQALIRQETERLINRGDPELWEGAND